MSFKTIQGTLYGNMVNIDDIVSVGIGGVDAKDHPHYTDAYICAAQHRNGYHICGHDLEQLTGEQHAYLVHKFIQEILENELQQTTTYRQ